MIKSSNDIIILGICDGHNAGACLLRNGAILAAISEERLSRLKNEAGYPKMAIKKVLELTDTHTEDIDLVALAGKFTHKKDFYSNWDWYKVGYKEQLSYTENKNKREQMSKKRLEERKNEILKDLNISENKLVVVEHHLAHAASAYYASPWAHDEKTLVLTCDGSGDGICATVNIGESGQLSRLSQTENSASLGKIYSRITLLMGMKPWEHEYKIMGLAPYADEKGVTKSYGVLNNLIEIQNDSLTFNTKTNLSTNFCYQYLRTELENHRFDWIAGAVQKLTEDLLIKWVRNAIKKTGIKKIACAGGIFMNVKANMLILEMDEVDDLFIFPSGGDESLAIGASFSAYAQYLNKIGQKVITVPLNSIYFGPSYSKDEIEKSVIALDDDYIVEYHDDINQYVAESLAKGDIVARFNERMEFGARALGNRSILSDPSRYEKLREINMAIKQRDFWMPFAPTILSEKQDEIIINSKNIKAPFMTLAFRTKDVAHKKFTSAIHPYDFTARPQVLEKNQNLGYHDLITHFYELTGIPGVLNTSFNLHGEPIVCSPKDAIQTLQNSGLKCLSIGNYFIRKRNH